MGKKKILVVDDEEQVLQLLEKRLLNESYDVVAATRGKDAILKAQKHLPDLILMDIVLPDIDGAEAVALLQQDPATRKIPILFLSGIVKEGSTEDEKFEVNVGGRAYDAIPKPFTFQKLLVEIRKLTEEERIYPKVFWDQKICMHSGHCVKTLPKVFKISDGKFIVDATQSPEKDILKTVHECPSGALKIQG